MSNFYHCSSRCTFFCGSQAALFFHFSGIIFPVAIRKTYWLKKLEMPAIKPWIIHWKIQTMRSKGRVEYFAEAVEFSLEKEKNLPFCLPSHLNALIGEYWNDKATI